MKHLSLLIAAVALVLTQCERHSWEDVKDADGNLTEKGTKRLFPVHAEKGGGHEDGHGKDDGQAEGEGDHEKPEKDGEAAH